MKNQISPYLGDSVHETPLALVLAFNLIEMSTPLMIFSYFVLLDLLAAIFVGQAAEKFKEFYVCNNDLEIFIDRPCYFGINKFPIVCLAVYELAEGFEAHQI